MCARVRRSTKKRQKRFSMVITSAVGLIVSCLPLYVRGTVCHSCCGLDASCYLPAGYPDDSLCDLARHVRPRAPLVGVRKEAHVLRLSPLVIPHPQPRSPRPLLCRACQVTAPCDGIRMEYVCAICVPSLAFCCVQERCIGHSATRVAATNNALTDGP